MPQRGGNGERHAETGEDPDPSQPIVVHQADRAREGVDPDNERDDEDDCEPSQGACPSACRPPQRDGEWQE